MKRLILSLCTAVLLSLPVLAQEKRSAGQQQMEQIQAELEDIRKENMYLKAELMKQEDHIEQVSAKQKALVEDAESEDSEALFQQMQTELQQIRKQNEIISEHLKQQDKEYKEYLKLIEKYKKEDGIFADDPDRDAVFSEMEAHQKRYEVDLERMKELDKKDGELSRQRMKAKRARFNKGRD